MHQEPHNAEPNTKLAKLNIVVCLACLPVLYLGAFTTSIGAGMVFSDWPLSDGSLNPEGWLDDEAKRSEHGHRLLGMLAGILTIAMVCIHAKLETRKWVKKLTYLAIVLIIVQGLLGGLRVIRDNVDIAIPHAILAQLFLCLLVSLIWVHTKRWNRLIYSSETYQKLSGIRVGALMIVVLIFIQLIIGAVMRHKGAWIMIRHFPFSTADGDLLPSSWDFLTAIHFAHRVMALIILLAFIVWAIRALTHLHFPKSLRSLVFLSALLLLVQIALGASIIWQHRPPIPTTFHVLTGACLLATLWSLTFLMGKPYFQKQKLTNVESVNNLGPEKPGV